jgi:hypothetical protein
LLPGAVDLGLETKSGVEVGSVVEWEVMLDFAVDETKREF